MKNKWLFLVILVLIMGMILVGCKDTSGFDINKDSLTIAVGDSVRIPIEIVGEGDVVLTITSGNTEVATVVDNYVVGIAVGSTTLTVTDGTTTKTIAVEVISSYNQSFVTVTFRVDPPANNPNVQPYVKTLQKQYYTSVNQTDNTLTNDVPNLISIWPKGYAFSGWKTNPECTIDAVFPTEITTKDVTFYGKWIIRDGTEANDPNIELDYEYNTVNGEYQATVKGFSHAGVPYQTIVIPTTVVLGEATYTVTTIKEGAFKNNPTLTTVTMPSVTTIGKQAFYGVTTLTSVTMKKITTIGESAFESCTALKTVTVDNTKLKSLGKHAFLNSGLEDIKTDTSTSFDDFRLDAIGTDAFKNTTFINKYTRGSRYIWINNDTENINVYTGFLFSKTYIAYDYDYVSSNFDKTITFQNNAIEKVSCTFAPDVKIVLMSYDNSTDAKNPNLIKQLFVEKGVLAENITIQ